MRRVILLLIVAALFLSAVTPALAQQPNLHVYYAGAGSTVFTALRLGKQFDLVSDPAQADVLVLNGAIPPGAAERYHSGAGLVLILGPELHASAVSALLGMPVELARQEEAISLDNAPGANGGLLEDVLWNSAPQIRERYTVSGQTDQSQPLVSGFDNHEWVLWALPKGQGRGATYIFNAFLNGDNPQIQEWAYFNYLIYDLTARAGGQAPLSFATYPASPVPHAAERRALVLLMAGLLLIAGLVFAAVRRYSRAHPELLDVLVSKQDAYAANQASTEWEEVGFHRPLGGFLLALMMGLVLFIPLIIYQSLILPVYILPSAQALGIWGRVTQFFNLLWFFFDMGTGLAFIKFFSQYRVNDPRKAIQYGQVFVWWQALSGAFQVALVILVASLYLPQTAYALYTWSVIIHTFIQIPGFYAVMKNALRGWQRSDYGTALELGTSLIFPMLTQPVIVLLMAAWGHGHPTFGPAMGGLLGMGIAAYATEALTFLLGIWLYRRLGYNTRLLFLAHFDWDTIKASFRFGVFDMLGSTAWAIGQAVEIMITQTRLVNYTEVWGNWVLAQNFVFGFNVTATLYDNLMPSISEAISNAYRKLSQYYSAMAYKWGGLVNGFIAAALLAVTDRFILGAAGPEFTRAASYSIPLLLWGAIQYPSWVGDNVQSGSNHPYLKTALIGMEQFIRIALAFLLIQQFQIYALIIAYFAGLLSKDIISYFVNNKVCYQQRFFFWQSLGAPVAAGAVHYVILRWVTGWIWHGDQITSVLIFLISILFSFPLYAFLYGLAGGWDDGTLGELKEAARLASFMRPLAWLFWACSHLGARISPLHGRFPISIREEALAEAAQLTKARVQLDQPVMAVKSGNEPADLQPDTF
jgi:O-antigen/teichoic acid export membrane protein